MDTLSLAPNERIALYRDRARQLCRMAESGGRFAARMVELAANYLCLAEHLTAQLREETRRP